MLGKFRTQDPTRRSLPPFLPRYQPMFEHLQEDHPHTCMNVSI